MMRGGCQFASVLAQFTRLRQASIAPYLITAEAKRNKTKGKDKELLEKELKAIKERFADSEMFHWLTDKNTDSGIESCKVRAIIEILKRIKASGEKVLIFSMFSSCLDLIADAIKKHIPDYEYVHVDGDVTGNERSQSIESFRRNDDVKVMLMTYKVGSEGLTLVEANHCICIEPWWTNAVHNQAKARIHRPGQTKEVFMHNVLVDGSIEEKVMEICKDKDQLEDEILNGTIKTLGKNQGLNKFTLGKILGVR
jgi:SNF2 family DNA or RNA helicase